MLKLYACVAEQHDLWMVVLAALVCILGGYATFAIGAHAKAAGPGVARRRWMVVTLVTCAFSIWATHFIAMLAFRVPFPSGFLPLPTIGSAVIALVMVAVAAYLAISSESRRSLVAGGAVLGLAISAMHYTGMSAFRVTGSITWDPLTVAVSVLLGLGFSIAAVLATRGTGRLRVVWPATWFALAVCGDHFVGMSAATVSYDPNVALPADLIGGRALSLPVAAIALLVVAGALVAYGLSRRARRRVVDERRRVEDLADFSVEGLLICDGRRIVWANRSIEGMLPGRREDLRGRALDSLLPVECIERLSADHEIDTVLMAGDTTTPVRVITKAIAFDGKPHTVIAFRDQRDRLRAEAEMRRLAVSDPLTGLANRAGFNEFLERMLTTRRSGERGFALLSLDLDRFKHVNDAHGHGAGDALLVRVAKRLTSVVREGGLVARIGGDEFSVIVAAIDGPDGVRALAERIVEILSRPFVIDGDVHEIGTSVGVALSPSDGTTAEALVRNADLALYRAKHDGRGVYRLFEKGMDARMQMRRGLELALRRAVARQEFRLEYQPLVDARTGKCTGAEALIRWTDPERGVVPPSEFIPIAEETNLIAGIGEWVLHTACGEAMRWPDHLSVAVNLSPLQFRDPRLLSIVASALEESGLPATRLELEITESALIDDENVVLGVLQEFRKLGIRLSLDDFGTGYSSLGHLHRFPFDRIKIDRSFVSRAPDDRDSAAIVRAIVSLGTSLGMTTTAEGVETDAQRRFVAAEGCDSIQGFFFSRPVPVAGLPAVFHQSNEPAWPSSDFFIAAKAS